MPPRRRNHVNNEADPAFTAAVAHAVADLLPTLTARITNEIRQNENNRNNDNRRNARRVNTEGSGNDGNAQPIDIHVWILNIEFTDVAQVANAARNVKIFCDRPKNEGNNKRDKDGHRIRPSDTPAQGSNQRAYDRRDSDRYGDGGRYGNKDKYRNNGGRSDRQGSDKHGSGSDKRGTSTQRVWRDHDQHVRGQKYGRSYGSSSQRGYSDYASSPPCTICGKFHPGKACHRATGACFECGEVGHLAKDRKKGSTSSRGNKNNKPQATSGRVFALTTEQAAKAPCTILGTLYMYDSGVFVLFDTGSTHSVVLIAFFKHLKVPPIPLDNALSL
nr:hypothetical protein [Tanacetum cinerariifolium]